MQRSIVLPFPFPLLLLLLLLLICLAEVHLEQLPFPVVNSLPLKVRAKLRTAAATVCHFWNHPTNKKYSLQYNYRYNNNNNYGLKDSRNHHTSPSSCMWCLHAAGSGKGFGTPRTGGRESSNASNSIEPSKKRLKDKLKRGIDPSPSSSSSSSSTNTITTPPTATSTGTTSLNETENPPPLGPKNRPYVKAEQNQWLEQLTEKASQTELGQIVAKYNRRRDPFWDFMPALIASKFPNASDHDLRRIVGFVQHALSPPNERPSDWLNLPHRPYEDLHAYMPGLPPPTPFIDPSTLQVCQQLQDNYEIIRDEYQSLLVTCSDQFQSVTSMNYDSGWKTLVLFYNGHRIPKFPYHLCPTTTRILETLPIAGRIAGFNRQSPASGIPLHTDGNNLWLTCQMGIQVPPNNTAFITVADEQRHWHNGRCLVYDTTFAHRTWNPDPQHERIVLHVDFFNTLALTDMEIKILQYMYKLREDFMKAEGVAKVGAQIL